MYASTPCFALQNGRCMTQPFYPHNPITADCVATPWNMYFWNNVSALLQPGHNGDAAACPSDSDCWISHTGASRAPAPSPSPSLLPSSGNATNRSTHWHWQLSVTLLLVASPRPGDSRDRGDMLLRNLAATRMTTGLTHSQAVVMFDGMLCRQKDPTGAIGTAYFQKIFAVWKAFQRHDRSSVVVHTKWLHLAELARRTMLLDIFPATPLVFVMQEDHQIVPHVSLGTPIPGIHEIVHLMLQNEHGPRRVNCVHFTQRLAGTDPYHGRCYSGSDDKLCKTHPSYPSIPLRSTATFNDQPHLIRRSHYEDVVWQTVPRGYRTATEHHANAFATSEGNWSGWIYAGPATNTHTTQTGNKYVSSYAAMSGAVQLKENPLAL